MISLRSLHQEDIRLFAIWWRDEDLIAATSGESSVLTDEQLAYYFDGVLHSKDRVVNAMIVLEGRGAIGHVAIVRRDNNWGEMQIVIGDKELHGKGYGTESIRQAVDLAMQRGLSRIYLEVRPDNAKAIRAYHKAGFRLAGEFTSDDSNATVLLRMELV